MSGREVARGLQRITMKQQTTQSEPQKAHLLRRNLIVGIFLLLNVTFLVWVFLRQFPEYPTGWDAPYYMSYTKSFLELGETSSRAGMVTIVGALHSTTGVSILNIYRAYTVASMVLLALGTALLATTVHQKRMTTFLSTFFFALWYQYYFMLSLSTFDNALGVILVVYSCYFLSSKTRKKENAIAFFSLAALLAVTHIESFAFLMLILAIFFIIHVLKSRSIVSVIREKFWFLLATISAAVIALFQWLKFIGSFFQSYSKTADVGGNASIPYAENQSLGGFFHFAGTGITDTPTVLLFLIGIVLLVFLAQKKPNDSGRTVLIAYILAAYLLLLFSVLRASIPINRSILLLPVPIVVGLGMSWYFTFLQRERKIGVASISAVFLFFAILPTSKYLTYVQRVPPSIHHSVYDGIVDLDRYQADHVTGSFVVLGNTQQEVKAASAYYGLWYYWLTTILPTSDKTKGYCVYFGSLSNFSSLLPTVRSENQEYNDTNKESLRCIQTLPQTEPIRLFSIRGLYPGVFPPELPSTESVLITDNLAEIRILPSSDIRQ